MINAEIIFVRGQKHYPSKLLKRSLRLYARPLFFPTFLGFKTGVLNKVFKIKTTLLLHFFVIFPQKHKYFSKEIFKTKFTILQEKLTPGKFFTKHAFLQASFEHT